MEHSKKLHIEVKNDEANKRFIGSIKEKGFPIVVVGSSSAEIEEKMNLAVRLSCFLKNFQTVDKMLSANIYDLNLVEKEAQNTNFELAPLA